MASTRIKVSRLKTIEKLKANKAKAIKEAQAEHKKLEAKYKKDRTKYERALDKWTKAVRLIFAELSGTFTYDDNQTKDTSFTYRYLTQRNGQINIDVPLKPPTPHEPGPLTTAHLERQYDRAIGLLEMSDDDTVAVSYDDIGYLL